MDGALTGAYVTGAFGFVAAVFATVLAYRRGRNSDDRNFDLENMRQMALNHENDRQSWQRERQDLNERVTAMTKRVDHCEEEKDALHRLVWETRLELAVFKREHPGA